MKDYKHKVFCDLFVKSFDFAASCKGAKVQQNKMIAKLYDKDSEISEYIRAQIDIFAMSNSFITVDVIRYKLGHIVLNNESKAEHVISSAKLLLGFDETPDKAGEFLKLIQAVKQGKDNVATSVISREVNG